MWGHGELLLGDGKFVSATALVIQLSHVDNLFILIDLMCASLIFAM